jgi:hypothetical protein
MVFNMSVSSIVVVLFLGVQRLHTHGPNEIGGSADHVVGAPNLRF